MQLTSVVTTSSYDAGSFANKCMQLLWMKVDATSSGRTTSAKSQHWRQVQTKWFENMSELSAAVPKQTQAHVGWGIGKDLKGKPLEIRPALNKI